MCVDVVCRVGAIARITGEDTQGTTVNGLNALKTLRRIAKEHGRFEVMQPIELGGDALLCKLWQNRAEKGESCGCKLCNFKNAARDPTETWHKYTIHTEHTPQFRQTQDEPHATVSRKHKRLAVRVSSAHIHTTDRDPQPHPTLGTPRALLGQLVRGRRGCVSLLACTTSSSQRVSF